MQTQRENSPGYPGKEMVIAFAIMPAVRSIIKLEKKRGIAVLTAAAQSRSRSELFNAPSDMAGFRPL